MNRLLLIFVLVWAAIGCSNMGSQAGREVVAKAGNAVLYADEIPVLFEEGTSAADSAILTNNYITRWAKREFLLQKANENLGYEVRRNIEIQVNETRANLVIYQYQRQMMEEKMDTIIKENELEAYYNNNGSNFPLRSNIVKALYIKLPLDISETARIRALAQADDPGKVAELESLCYQNAVQYDDFNENWIAFDRLTVELPVNIDNEEEYLMRNTFFEGTDSLFTYFVKLRDYKLRSTVAPYEYVKTDIERIILNNRRVGFIQSLENEIYSDAVSKNSFTIY